MEKKRKQRAGYLASATQRHSSNCHPFRGAVSPCTVVQLTLTISQSSAETPSAIKQHHIAMGVAN